MKEMIFLFFQNIKIANCIIDILCPVHYIQESILNEFSDISYCILAG